MISAWRMSSELAFWSDDFLSARPSSPSFLLAYLVLLEHNGVKLYLNSYLHFFTHMVSLEILQFIRFVVGSSNLKFFVVKPKWKKEGSKLIRSDKSSMVKKKKKLIIFCKLVKTIQFLKVFWLNHYVLRALKTSRSASRCQTPVFKTKIS
jgi:hypothetical protein